MANRAARELPFGTVWINDHMPVASEMPFAASATPAMARTWHSMR
jgi:acyl-CoA reductase-like NAD-dependent aldehyde dehydrogenase